jgi:hypothetical protein
VFVVRGQPPQSRGPSKLSELTRNATRSTRSPSRSASRTLFAPLCVQSRCSRGPGAGLCAVVAER